MVDCVVPMSDRYSLTAVARMAATEEAAGVKATIRIGAPSKVPISQLPEVDEDIPYIHGHKGGLLKLLGGVRPTNNMIVSTLSKFRTIAIRQGVMGCADLLPSCVTGGFKDYNAPRASQYTVISYLKKKYRYLAGTVFLTSCTYIQNVAPVHFRARASLHKPVAFEKAECFSGSSTLLKKVLTLDKNAYLTLF